MIIHKYTIERVVISLNIPVILLLSAATFFMILNFPPVYAQEDVNMLFEKGKESYMAGNPEEAISYFDKVLEIEPNHVDALNNIGAILITLGKHNEAISYFDRVLEIEPNHVGSLSNKGSALGSLGEYDDAILYLDKALEFEPNHADALNNKAAIFIEQGNYYDALSIFQKVLKIDSTNELAKKYIPRINDNLGYEAFGGFTDVLVRDSEGQLIAYFKRPFVQVLNHELALNFVNEWDVSEKITLNGTDYEVLHRAYYTDNSDLEGVFSSLYIENLEEQLNLVRAPSWGIPIHPGDKITHLYTIFKKI